MHPIVDGRILTRFAPNPRHFDRAPRRGGPAVAGSDRHPKERHVLHGSTGLLVAYLITLGAYGVGLYKRREAGGRYAKAPLVALALTAISGAVAALFASALRAAGLEHAPFALLGALGCAAVGFTAAWWWPGRGAVGVARGTVLAGGGGRGTAPSARGREPGVLAFAGEPLALEDEAKHFKVVGTTGTGKSSAIRALAAAALARGDRMVIADPDAGFLAGFHDAARGDVILNPFDDRSRKWDVYAEIRADYDYDQLARSLIPEGSASDRVWRTYAQTFFACVLRQSHLGGERDVAELYRLLTSAPVEELRLLLAGTPAQPFVEEANLRMFGSIRAVAGAATAPLGYVQRQRGEAFSVREWIRAGRGVLFLPYQADQVAALRSIISTWMRIAIVETMSRGEGDHRLWFVVDELDALGAIDGLKDALARLRKFGGRCVLGFQSIAQVSGTYGESEAQTIVENCGNTLILRCSASEHGGTARFASRLIGEREVVRAQLSRTRPAFGLGLGRRAVTHTEQHVVEAAVLASEIEQLPDLEGYLKLASRPEWRRVRLAHA
jgi:hypothetical protein